MAGDGQKYAEKILRRESSRFVFGVLLVGGYVVLPPLWSMLTCALKGLWGG